jgi:hypothetical protein
MVEGICQGIVDGNFGILTSKVSERPSEVWVNRPILKREPLHDGRCDLCFCISILTITVSSGFDGTCNRTGRETQWQVLPGVNQTLSFSGHRLPHVNFSGLNTTVLFCACRNFAQELRMKAVMVMDCVIFLFFAATRQLMNILSNSLTLSNTNCESVY